MRRTSANPGWNCRRHCSIGFVWTIRALKPWHGVLPRSRPRAIPLAHAWPSGRARMACGYRESACLSASSASFMRAGPMSPLTPARCASSPATRRFCAAVRKAYARAAPFTAVCRKGWSPRSCRRRAFNWCPTTDRAAVGHMLGNMADSIDVIVPRGGKSLISRVRKEARVPVIGHLEGVCHVYVHRDADLTMSKRIVLNAKMRRTGVCGSAETLLVDRGLRERHILRLWCSRCSRPAARCGAMR